ncbi:hypothetical protein BAE44_0001010 [Dichanthelium oligosanthes]|uniref:F-box domain-containing protein n=1 Tax=Dichanthelium oligosanthes TaxID=888268 RepID=A0A1E5WKP0_9POAL|nr:hypothetical protein BAE44_0001010 [Dichanthelium oligosanthes]
MRLVGLLLCRRSKRPGALSDSYYLMCNPATKQWVALPPNGMELRGVNQAYHLGFDPAISSHFRMFMFLPGYESFLPFKGVMIFSSETGAWVYSGRYTVEEVMMPFYQFNSPFADQMAKRSRKKKTQQRVPSLPDELIVEILSRVPYRSLCRFKCVSRSWHDLCSDPDLRKKSLQTLPGFFCRDRSDSNLHFLNLSGRGRPLVDLSLPYFHGYEGPMFQQCCISLLLWKIFKWCAFDPEYVVCNPATHEWIVLPPTLVAQPWHIARLGFDPAAPSCFYVFVFVMRPRASDLVGTEIYSSQTGRWIYRQSEWGDNTEVDFQIKSVFFNGTLYSTAPDLSVLTVDTEGKIWKKIRMPHSYIEPTVIQADAFITHSQGCLYAMHIDINDNNRLSVWALQMDGDEQWILKHTASIQEVFGRQHESYTLIAAHPDHNMIFLTGGMRGEVMSYDMDNQEVTVIRTLRYFQTPMFPYIPCFAELPSYGCRKSEEFRVC